jgi:5-methylcytosine-specific restriction enzyme A
MKRDEFSNKTKDEAAKRAQGSCESCHLPFAGRPAYDHILPAEYGGRATLANCHVLCRACHAAKTKDDIRGIRKADRQRKASVGAKRETQKITQRAKEEKPPSGKLPIPPPRALYEIVR